MCIDTTPCSWVSLPTHLVATERRAELPVLCSRFPLAISFTRGSGHTHSQFPHLPRPHICSLHLHLYFCPENRFTCIIFLDSTYMRSYTIFVFLFMTQLTLYDRLCPSALLQMTPFCSCLSNISLYVPRLLYSSVNGHLGHGFRFICWKR